MGYVLEGNRTVFRVIMQPYMISIARRLNVVIMCQGIIFKARLEVDAFEDEAMNAIAVQLA